MSRLSFARVFRRLTIAKDAQAFEVPSAAFVRRHSLQSPSAVQNAGRLELLREMNDFKREVEIEGLSIDPVNDDLVVLNNRGTQIVLGMSKGPITDEGYDKEIHEF